MTVRWISEREVVEALTLPRAIDAIERALAREAVGAAKTMLKTHVGWGDGHTLHAIGGVDGDLVGTKTWAHTAGGANPLLILWDSETGERRAVIEAFALGQLRTAAMSGLATRLLASLDTTVAAVIGTGKQALPQASALRTVLPALREIRVFGRDPGRKQAMASRIEAEMGVAAVLCDTIAAAADGAGVITTATRATEPFLASSFVARGSHVNAIGAITPERAELLPDLIDRAFIVADSVDQARNLASEVQGRNLRALSSLIGGSRPAADITLFKAMGIGLADVALGRAIIEAA
jgi:ornithine cyclodeaminase